MAITAEDLGTKYGITRADVDEYSYQSHKKATAAYEKNLLQGPLSLLVRSVIGHVFSVHYLGEITPIAVKKDTITKDEHIRPDVSLADVHLHRNRRVTSLLALTVAALDGQAEGCFQEGRPRHSSLCLGHR